MEAKLGAPWSRGYFGELSLTSLECFHFSPVFTDFCPVPSVHTEQKLSGKTSLWEKPET